MGRLRGEDAAGEAGGVDLHHRVRPCHALEPHVTDVPHFHLDAWVRKGEILLDIKSLVCRTHNVA